MPVAQSGNNCFYAAWTRLWNLSACFAFILPKAIAGIVFGSTDLSNTSAFQFGSDCCTFARAGLGVDYLTLTESVFPLPVS